MVNCALRTMGIDTIIKMGFFIKDLQNHIKALHQEQFKDVDFQEKLIVHRGQGMSKTDFEHLTKTKGGLLSFNNFLSTSNDRSISLRFANRAIKNPDMMGVLFIITINLLQSTAPFASVKNVSAMKGEDEVLFTMQIVFRIGNITAMDENSRLQQVELTLTNDDDKDLRELIDYIRKETYPNEEGWFRLGCVLYKIGQFEKSEVVYQILLEQATTDADKAYIYVHVGNAKNGQGEYEEAITLYEKAVAILENDLPSQKLNLAAPYRNIGEMYRKMGDYFEALLYYEKALEIRQQLLPPNHPDLAVSYINIGNVYAHMGEYSIALSYFEISLEIQKQSLPPNHPDVAVTYGNIGNVYSQMGEYSKALSYYEKSLEIKQQSLSPNHPSLAASNYNNGLLYEKMLDYSQAQLYYKRALVMGQQSLPPNHHYLEDYRTVLEIIKEKL